MLEETDRKAQVVDNGAAVLYDSKAAGGLGEPSPPVKSLCRRHKYDIHTCSACAENKNHGDKETTQAVRTRYTKSRPKEGLSWRQAWYDRQAKTLEHLRRSDDGR